ncbi:ABC transporter permease subunit [Candidatus Gracilibacteria bacterium]|nr:ABC transporter permease subunit [Candidatus Gracilibacteria bacterium]
MLNIALNTFKEIIRNKYLYTIVIFGVLFIFLSLALSKLTIGDTSKITIDFGLSMIEVFGLIGVLFIGSQLLFNEIEGKTIFLILSKPIKRNDFIIGKFVGFSMVIFFISIFQGILYLLMLFLQNIEITNLIIWSIVNTFFKIEIVLGLVFFFSSFMGSLMTIIASILIYLLGQSFSVILDLAYKSGNEIIIFLSKGLGIIIPKFEALNTKDYIGTFSDFSNTFLFSNLAVTLLYIIVLIILTNIIFSKKEFY